LFNKLNTFKEERISALMKAFKASNTANNAIQTNFVADTYLTTLICWMKCQHSLGHKGSTDVNISLAEKWMEQKEHDLLT
jgi:hypothetical protein